MSNHPFHLLALALMVLFGAAVAACDAPTGSGGTSVAVGRQGLAPAIDSVEPEPAAPGDEVTIRGYFHKLRQDDGLFVSFNGYDSQKVTHVSDSLLTAVVPEGATSGNVVVVIGESVGKGRFMKIKDKKRS